jgi:hormone-sensitive lipase
LYSQDFPIDLDNEFMGTQAHSPGLLKKTVQFLKSFCTKIPRPLARPIKGNAIDKIIIHVHGGGFISMSSSSHQCYTRIWANETGVPVFSIDYRLSPKWQFPAALNDVWQTYHFLLERGA